MEPASSREMVLVAAATVATMATKCNVVHVAIAAIPEAQQQHAPAASVASNGFST